MKKLLVGLFTVWAVAHGAAADGTWTTDVPKALQKAKAEQKLVLLDFTGSDWCGWCIRFNKEGFSTPEFREYAAKHLVLVELDFPRAKKLAPELKQANDALKAKYRVNGFPTFVLLNCDGREVGRQVGYMEGGPKAFIAKLQSFKSS